MYLECAGMWNCFWKVEVSFAPVLRVFFFAQVKKHRYRDAAPSAVQSSPITCYLTPQQSAPKICAASAMISCCKRLPIADGIAAAGWSVLMAGCCLRRHKQPSQTASKPRCRYYSARWPMKALSCWRCTRETTIDFKLWFGSDPVQLSQRSTVLGVKIRWTRLIIIPCSFFHKRKLCNFLDCSSLVHHKGFPLPSHPLPRKDTLVSRFRPDLVFLAYSLDEFVDFVIGPKISASSTWISTASAGSLFKAGLPVIGSNNSFRAAPSSASLVRVLANIRPMMLGWCPCLESLFSR